MGVLDNKSIEELLASFSQDDPKIALREYILDRESKRKKIVVLIHGMNTYGAWQDTAKKLIKEADSNVKVIPLKFENLDPLNFLYLFRFLPVKRVLEQIRGIASENEGANISVIAHSFGTYIIMKILKNHSDIKLYRVILCGSVVPRQFKWENVRRFPIAGMINDVGLKDLCPVAAKFFTFGYGSSGTFGFGHYQFEDRFHNCSHSGFFDELFIKKYWVPYILNGETIPSDFTEKKVFPWYIASLDKKFLVWCLIWVIILFVYTQSN